MTTKPAQPVKGKQAGWPASKDLIESLVRSKIFQDYASSFSEMTGVAVLLRAAHEPGRESPLCALVSRKAQPCEACANPRQETVRCRFGWVNTGVPVRLGNLLIGLLQTDWVLHEAPESNQIEQVTRLAAGSGVDISREQVEKLHAETKIVPSQQYSAMIRLLGIFAEHISALGHQIAVVRGKAESPVIQRAKQFIAGHQAAHLSLSTVAKAVNTSPFYFCKLFRKETGLHFTEYVSRVRIETARGMLLDPHLRVGEVAYGAGFRSLTHFNRVFKRLAGQSPSDYRGQAVRACR